MKGRAQKRSSRKKRTVEVQETTQFVTEPTVEIRKSATLAQALTEPAVAVVKPQTQAVRRRKVIRRAA